MRRVLIVGLWVVIFAGLTFGGVSVALPRGSGDAGDSSGSVSALSQDVCEECAQIEEAWRQLQNKHANLNEDYFDPRANGGKGAWVASPVFQGPVAPASGSGELQDVLESFIKVLDQITDLELNVIEEVSAYEVLLLSSPVDIKTDKEGITKILQELLNVEVIIKKSLAEILSLVTPAQANDQRVQRAVRAVDTTVAYLEQEIRKVRGLPLPQDVENEIKDIQKKIAAHRVEKIEAKKAILGIKSVKPAQKVSPVVEGKKFADVQEEFGAELRRMIKFEREDIPKDIGALTFSGGSAKSTLADDKNRLLNMLQNMLKEETTSETKLKGLVSQLVPADKGNYWITDAVSAVSDTVKHVKGMNEQAKRITLFADLYDNTAQFSRGLAPLTARKVNALRIMDGTPLRVGADVAATVGAPPPSLPTPASANTGNVPRCGDGKIDPAEFCDFKETTINGVKIKGVIAGIPSLNLEFAEGANKIILHKPGTPYNIVEYGKETNAGTEGDLKEFCIMLATRDCSDTVRYSVREGYCSPDCKIFMPRVTCIDNDLFFDTGESQFYVPQFFVGDNPFTSNNHFSKQDNMRVGTFAYVGSRSQQGNKYKNQCLSQHPPSSAECIILPGSAPCPPTTQR